MRVWEFGGRSSFGGGNTNKIDGSSRLTPAAWNAKDVSLSDRTMCKKTLYSYSKQSNVVRVQRKHAPNRGVTPVAWKKGEVGCWAAHASGAREREL